MRFKIKTDNLTKTKGGRMTIEEIKERLVEKQIEYIHNLVDTCNHEELYEFVYLNCFSNFKDMSDEEIKEEYQWRYGEDE